MWRAIVDATHYASDPAHRKEIAAAIAPTNYLNQPVTVLEQVLTGTYADGLGNIKKEPNRIDFDPYPWHSMAIWILTQMKRWGHLKGDVNYKTVAEQVYRAADCDRIAKETRLSDPSIDHGQACDYGQENSIRTAPDAYVEEFQNSQHGVRRAMESMKPTMVPDATRPPAPKRSRLPVQRFLDRLSALRRGLWARGSSRETQARRGGGMAGQVER